MNGSAIHFYVQLVLGALQEVHTRADISVQIALHHTCLCNSHDDDDHYKDDVLTINYISSYRIWL